MGNTENEEIVERYKKSQKTKATICGVIIGVLILSLFLVLVPLNQIIYDDKYEELYEHQVEYLMNEVPDFDDVFEKEEFCNFVDIDIEQGGIWVEQNDKVYFQDLKINFTNISNKNFTDLSVSLIYEDYAGERGQFDVTLGEALAGESITKEIKMPRLCKVEDVCYVSESRVKNAICYAVERGEERPTPYEVRYMVDEDLIKVLIGNRPESRLSDDTREAISYITIYGSIIAFIVMFNAISNIGKVKKGCYKIEDGRLKLTETKFKNVIEEIIEEEEEVEDENMQEEKPLEEIGKTLPSDFDDGHETTHDCGGFDIDKSQYEINQDDYKWRINIKGTKG